MNGELFALEPDAPRDVSLDYLLALGITACPVIDEAGSFKGMVSVRDLMGETGGNRVRDRITEPVLTVSTEATIEEAAHRLTQAHAHRVVAVDGKGRAAGMVSAVDLVAALVGEPVAHPSTFPRIDSVTGLSFSEDRVFEPEQSEAAPSEPGVIVLVYGRAGSEEVPVWIEDARDLRARIDSMLNLPQSDQPELARLLERDHQRLRFRLAVVTDEAQRTAAVSALRADLARRRRLG